METKKVKFNHFDTGMVYIDATHNVRVTKEDIYGETVYCVVIPHCKQEVRLLENTTIEVIKALQILLENKYLEEEAPKGVARKVKMYPCPGNKYIPPRLR